MHADLMTVKTVFSILSNDLTNEQRPICIIDEFSIKYNLFNFLNRKKYKPDIFEMAITEIKIMSNFELDLEDKIIQECCSYFGVDEEIAKSMGRGRRNTTIRAFIYYMLKKECRYTLKYIGSLFSGKDHSTVFHALETLEQHHQSYAKEKQKFEKDYDNIMKNIND